MTPSQKILLIKLIHLLTAFVVVGVIFFALYTPKTDIDKNIVVNDYTINDNLSSYEQFCSNNADINCGTFQSFVENNTEKPQIILMDTDEVSAEKLSDISIIASAGSDINIAAEDMNKLLDHIYEEKLPDNIIETDSTESANKVKNITIKPEHKPPYFGKEPSIVIVIDDMGVSTKRTSDIASIKAPLTVSFLTYASNLEAQIQNSRQNGQEIMMHVPMEAKTAVDVAPDVLTTSMSVADIKNNLRQMIKKFKNVKGINNHMGSKLTEDYTRMKAVAEVLKSERMYFLDSKTSADSKAEKAAADSGIAYAHRHVFLDNINDKSYILGQLAKTENIARKNGYAIAIGHPKTQTYVALKEWLPDAAKRGIKIIPLSQAVAILNPHIDY